MQSGKRRKDCSTSCEQIRRPRPPKPHGDATPIGTPLIPDSTGCGRGPPKVRPLPSRISLASAWEAMRRCRCLARSPLGLRSPSTRRPTAPRECEASSRAQRRIQPLRSEPDSPFRRQRFSPFSAPPADPSRIFTAFSAAFAKVSVILTDRLNRASRTSKNVRLISTIKNWNGTCLVRSTREHQHPTSERRTS